ncbi:MAG: metal ABC transporter ATP-binding protein [Acidimicrobiia bacterium]|nr:metal ABC transporter ATP-binding protein [Acidimicrobiia bacterium]
MTCVVETNSLAVGYGDTRVLSDVDISLEPGRMLALVGGNGSGKTTLLRTVAGLLRPLGGELHVFSGHPGSAPSRTAYLGQHHHVNEALAVQVRDVVAMGRFPSLGLLRRMRDVDTEAVNAAMRRVGVASLAHTALHELSGGQRQRVYLAQALAHVADLYLLDEATAGIDAGGRDTYLQALDAERERGAAVVTATHDFGEARRADDVLLLAGRVVSQGPPRTALTRDNLLAAFGVSLTEMGAGEIVHEVAHHHHGDHQHDPGHE